MFAGLSGFGEAGRYRNARHLVAFASVPLILSLLVVWPLRLAAFGGDVFRDRRLGQRRALDRARRRRRGAPRLGGGARALGIRVVRQWGWRRTIGAYVLSIGVLAALAAGITLFT